MNSKDNRQDTGRHIGAIIFLSVFLVYCLASPGNLPGDTETRWSVARQIIRGKGLSLEESHHTRNSAVGVDGKRYSLWNLGQTLLLVPFAAVGFAVEKAALVSAETADLGAQFLVSIVLFPAIGAAGAWLFYRLVLLLGYGKKPAILSSITFALGTMYFHYSVCTQEQSQVAVLLLLSTILIVKCQSKPSFLCSWLLCVVFGICLLFRVTTLAMVVPMYVVVTLAEILRAQKAVRLNVLGKWVLSGLLGTGGFIVIVFWYNYTRFGNIFETGHRLATSTTLAGHELFGSSCLPTLAAMLFSPGKSIILYNPVLLLFPFSIYGFYRRHRVVALAAIFAVVGNFLLSSFYTTWAGDYAWSVRFQTPILPLLILPLAFLFSKHIKAVFKVLITSLILISCVIQIASVVYNFNLEFVQNPNHHLIPGDYVWDWSQSHLRKRFENIVRHISGRRDFSSVKVEDEEPLLLKSNQDEETVRFAYTVNFFPFKARAKLSSAKILNSLLAIWIALVGCLLVTGYKLIRVYREADKTGGKGENRQ